jgi:hypothetical protein
VVFVKFNSDKRNKYFGKQPFKYFNRRNISKINLLQLLLETHLTKLPKRANPSLGYKKKKDLRKWSKRNIFREELLIMLRIASVAKK